MPLSFFGNYLISCVINLKLTLDTTLTGARLIVWVFVRNGDFTVTLLLHGIDCGMIRVWAMVTIHR